MWPKIKLHSVTLALAFYTCCHQHRRHRCRLLRRPQRSNLLMATQNAHETIRSKCSRCIYGSVFRAWCLIKCRWNCMGRAHPKWKNDVVSRMYASQFVCIGVWFPCVPCATRPQFTWINKQNKVNYDLADYSCHFASRFSAGSEPVHSKCCSGRRTVRFTYVLTLI